MAFSRSASISSVSTVLGIRDGIDAALDIGDVVIFGSSRRTVNDCVDLAECWRGLVAEALTTF